MVGQEQTTVGTGVKGSQNYKPQFRDFVANKQPYEPSTFKPTTQKYEYKEYKPSHVGMYGEKQRAKIPKPRPEPPVTKPKERRPIKTFESYSEPRGPDIKVSEYKPLKYNPETKPYKPGTPYKPKYYDNQVCNMDNKNVTQEYKRPATYRLTEKNYSGKNNWNFGFVNDPMAWKNRDGEPKEEQKTERKPPSEPEKPHQEMFKEEPREGSVIEAPKTVPVVIPVQKKPKTPDKKMFKTSSTQHDLPALRTVPTQTQTSTKSLGVQSDVIPSKSTSVQTDTLQTPANVQPFVMAAPIPPIKSTKSRGVQCLDPKVKMVGKATQCERLSPIARNDDQIAVFESQHNRGYQDTPYETQNYSQAHRPPPLQRTPSPQIVPIVAVPANRRSPSPATYTKAPEVAQDVRYDHPAKVPEQQTPIIAPIYAPVMNTKPVQEKGSDLRNRTPTPETKLSTTGRRSGWTPPDNETTAHRTEPVQLKPPTPPKSPVATRNRADTYTKPETNFPTEVPTNSTYSKPPRVFVSPRVQTPPTEATGPYFERQSGGGFPYQSTKSRLPPEVTACIEAYDCAHAR